MVVCKFFQEGYCRYGQNCRFEHVYGSKYSYHAPASAPSPQPQQPQQQASGGVTDEQLVQQVHNDVQSALKGGQWLLSSYAPFKNPNLPGLPDLSPEEARLFIYEAKANNTVDQAVAYMNNLMKEARSKYEQLLTTSPNTVKVLRSLYNGETPASPFTSGQTPQNAFGQSSNNASSVFRSAVQNPQPTSPFGQANSVFNQSNVFPQQDTARTVFSQATQNVFGAQPQNQSIFGSQNAQSVFSQANSPDPKSIFAQANSTPMDPAQSFFAQANSSPADPAKAFFAQAASARSPFESAPAPTAFKSPFEQPSPFAQSSSPASVFGQATNVFQQTPADDPGVYSNINEIPAEDLEMFQADSFKLGFIPEMPPPHSLCV